MGNTVSAHIYEIKVFRPYPVILYRLRLDHSIHWWKKIGVPRNDQNWRTRWCRTIEYANFGRSEGHQFFRPPIDRVVQSESIQYNRVGSKDLNFVDMSKNSISH